MRKININQIKVNTAAGQLGVFFYLCLAIVARVMFPSTFNPVDNWLSDLGHRILNPDGSIFYRLAGILSGLMLLIFFGTIGIRARGHRKSIRVSFMLVSIFGGIASICFVMTGIFSEDMMPMHSWFSMANFISFGTAIGLTGLIALLGGGLPRWIAVLCLTAWFFDLVSGVFGQTRWLEWVVVAFLIAYVTAMAMIPISYQPPKEIIEKQTFDQEAL